MTWRGLGVVIVAMALSVVSVRAQELIVANRFMVGSALCVIRSGSGSPEGAVVGKVCDVYIRTDAGTIYAKNSGTGNTGWVQQARANTPGDLPTTVAYTNVGNIFDQKQRITANGENLKHDATTSTRETYDRWNNGTTNLLLGVEGSAGGALFVGTTAFSAVLGTQGSHPVIFATGNTNRVTLDTNGNLTPYVTDAADLGSPFKIWRAAHISEMHATLFAKETQSLYGGWLTVSKNAGTFAASVSSSDTTINFGMTMTPNQFVLVRAADNDSGAITHEYIQVGTLVSGTTYNVTRNLSGAGAKFWATGTPYMVRGVSGDGWVELNAFDTPRMSVWTQGSAYNNSVENIRIGHLTGMPNSSSGIGAYMGDATNYFRWDGTNLTVKGSDATIDNGGITLGSNTVAGYLSGAALKYRRASASGYGAGGGDVFGAYTSSVNSGSQVDVLTIENTMVTANNGGGFAGNVGRAVITLLATGWDTAGSGSAQPQAFINLDSGQAGAAVSSVALSGTSISIAGPVTTTSTITERSRSTPLGEWTAPAFSAGNFTASTGSWTVDSGDVATYTYTLVGKTITVVFEINATDVSATPASLNIAIPGGFSAARSTRALVQVSDAGGAVTTGVARVQATGTVIEVQSTIAGGAWATTSADDTLIRGQITFEIQ